MTMKKAILTTAGALGLLASTALGQTVTVSDSNVEAAIREDIGKSSGDLTMSDLAKVKLLDLQGLDLSKVVLPDGLVNLEEINLNRNVLSPSLFNPVRFPEDMANLKILRLDGNNMPSNLKPIEHLTSLEVLIISDNDFTEVEIPEGLRANLKELDLRFNDIQSIVFPEGFDNLEILNLERNMLKGSIFSGPVSFPNDLETLKILNLKENELGTLNVPAGLLSLEELLLDENELGSIKFNGPLPSIRIISAFRNKLRSLELPEGMANLETLDLFENEITEITIHDGLNTEPFFDLAGNPIERFRVPDGTHEDLITYFRRFDAEIIFFPPQLPEVFAATLPNGDFELTISGPIGTYIIFESPDLIEWAESETIVNDIGEVTYTRSIGAVPANHFRIERAPDPEEDE